MHKPIILAIVMMALLVGASPAPAELAGGQDRELIRSNAAQLNSDQSHFSLDCDTLYYGDFSIRRDSRLLISQDDPPVGIAPRICSDWGPEIRLTYTDTDSTYGATGPSAWVCGDTALLDFGYLLRQGPRLAGQDIIFSTDFGATWSAPHDFHNPGAVDQNIEGVVYGGGHLYVAGTDSRSYGRYIPFFRKSPGLGFAWDDPMQFLNLGAMYMSDCQVRGRGDTLYFIYYLVLGPFNNPVDTIYLCRSYDGGATWEEPLGVAHRHNASDGGIFFEVASGNLNIVYTGITPAGYTEVYLLSSADGGDNWITRKFSDDDSVSSQLPSMSRDSGDGLLVAWMDFKYGSGGGGFGGNILCRVSHDGGLTWGPERRATTSPSAFISSCLIEGDYLGVAWVDFRDGTLLTELYFAESLDSGAEWTEEFRLTYSPRDVYRPILVSSYPRGILFWEDSRDYDFGRYEIYMRRFDVDVSAINNGINGDHVESLIIHCYPNPFNSSVRIQIDGPLAKEMKLVVYDIRGQIISEIELQAKITGHASLSWDGKDTMGKEVSSGVYFLRVEAAVAVMTKRIILIR